MKVALAIDGSSCSLRATRFLIELIAGREGVEVYVLYVKYLVRHIDLLSIENRQRIERLDQERADHATADARDLLAKAKVPYFLHVVTGEDPAAAIVKMAREIGCNLIVMGTRGMGTIAGLVLGSVATKVAHLADMPVTLVK